MPRGGSLHEEEEQLTRDPLFGMELSETTAAVKIEYGGQTHYFCSVSCRARFEVDGESYIRHRFPCLKHWNVHANRMGYEGHVILNQRRPRFHKSYLPFALT